MARTITTNAKTLDLTADTLISCWMGNYLKRIDTKGQGARDEFNKTKRSNWQKGTISTYRIIGYATIEELDDAIPYYASRWDTPGGNYGYQHMTIGGLTNINNSNWDDNVAYMQVGGSVIGLSDNANDLTSLYYGRKPVLTVYNKDGTPTRLSTGVNIIKNLPEVLIRGRFIDYSVNLVSNSEIMENRELWYEGYYSPIRHHAWRPIILAVSETGGKIKLVTNSPNVKFGVHFSSGGIEFGSTNNAGIITVTNRGDISDENRWVRIVIYLNGVEWSSSFRHAIKYMNNADEAGFTTNRLYNPSGSYNNLVRIVQEPTLNGMKRFSMINNITDRTTNVTDLISGKTIELARDRKGYHQELSRYIIEVPESQKVIALKVSDNFTNNKLFISNTIAFYID